MILWIDAQISPAIAPWIKQNFPIDAFSLKDIGLRDAEDFDIFHAAKSAGAVVLTKDADFLILLDRFGVPPQIIWLTCGNTSNARLKSILTVHLSEALRLLESGEPLIEISDL